MISGVSKTAQQRIKSSKTTEGVFPRFILFCESQEFETNPFNCKAKSVAKFLKECVVVLNQKSVVFERRSLLEDVVKTIEKVQKKTFENVVPKLSESAEIIEFLDVVESVDLGFDSKLGSPSHRDVVLELTADCKYWKYIQVCALPNMRISF